MEAFLRNIVFGNFRRKTLSLLAATVVWFFVSASITKTRTFVRIPVRIVNIPANKTVKGLLPDGFLDKRISVTLTGSKDVIDRMGSQDFEVRIDASGKGDEWVVELTKADLVSQNLDIQLTNSIKQVSCPQPLVIHLSRPSTEKIPVLVLPPQGDVPEGYQFHAVWPTRLYHTVTGPEEDVKKLQEEGMTLSIDMSDIKRSELDGLRKQQAQDGESDDEVSYFVPDSLKKIKIPFLKDTQQPINSPEARQLRIDFLHNDMLSLNSIIPVRLFYPIKTMSSINPERLFLKENSLLRKDEGVFYIDRPLMVSAVSRLFLDIIRENIEIVIVPAVKDGVVTFHWNVELIDSNQLEEKYVSDALSNEFDAESSVGGIKVFRQYLKQREEYLRSQFREYLKALSLFASPTTAFGLTITSDSLGAVSIKEEVK